MRAADAASLFFLIQPIKFSICAVVIAVDVVNAKDPYLILLDIALAKCQQATIQNKIILIGNFKTQSYVLCMAFFLVKYPRQLEMSEIVMRI